LDWEGCGEKTRSAKRGNERPKATKEDRQNQMAMTP